MQPEVDPIEAKVRRRLRWEAGEGWFSDGINFDLLGELVFLEEIKEMAEKNSSESQPFIEKLRSEQAEKVRLMREAAGMPEPPPLPTEEK